MPQVLQVPLDLAVPQVQQARLEPQALQVLQDRQDLADSLAQLVLQDTLVQPVKQVQLVCKAPVLLVQQVLLVPLDRAALLVHLARQPTLERQVRQVHRD